MAITFDKTTQTFYLDGKNTTYAFYINALGYAEHLYYGKKIGHDLLLYTKPKNLIYASHDRLSVPGKNGAGSYNLMDSELSFFGTGDFRESCVHVKNAKGDRLNELLYDGHTILTEKPKISGMPSLRGGETLLLRLSDSLTGLSADLYYTVFDDCDVIARRIVYRNCSDEVKVLKRAYSFTMTLPDGEYDMLSLYGCWSRERQVERYPIHRGVSSIDSKKGESSANLNPFIAILSPDATEASGEAYGFNLVYSSSFVLKAERNPTGVVLVTGGINDFDFEWKLEPGEEFETPEVVITFSDEGISGMSRQFHDAYRNHLIPERYAFSHRPLLINNWEATIFNFTTQKLIDIVDSVVGTGIDTFVLDDGWFGDRNDEKSGLGDWFVNESKFDGGLERIIDHVHSVGMKFGLWFEPEMINEDSEIYRKHPDYAIGGPDGRPRCYGRCQFVMDITRADVRDYIVGAVNKMLDNYAIDYVKWDFNRAITEFFSLGREADRQSEFAHRYALGLYDICSRIIDTHPDIFFEGCASGGARFDPAILYYFPQIWASDDSDAAERTVIQYGTSIPYPLSSMSCHVSAVPNHQVKRITTFKTRADIAHLGATGYELDTSLFTEEDKDTVKKQVAEYLDMEKLILCGDLYRIDNPMESNYFSEAIVSKDKKQALLVCYRSLCHLSDHVYRIRMRGLDPNKKYYVPELEMILSGSTLMSVGIAPSFKREDFTTVIYHFEEK